MIIQVIRDANKEIEFQVIEPQINFEIALYRYLL